MIISSSVDATLLGSPPPVFEFHSSQSGQVTALHPFLFIVSTAIRQQGMAAMRQLTTNALTLRRNTCFILSIMFAVELIASFTFAFVIVPTKVISWRAASLQRRQAPGIANQCRRQTKNQPRIHSTSPSVLQRSASASKTGGKLIVSDEAFAAAVTASIERPLLAFFTAPWCGPCRLSVPVVKDVMKQFLGQIDCCEICTDDLPDVASDSGVISIPTIHLYSDGG